MFANFESVLGKAQVFMRMCEVAPIANLAFSGGEARGMEYAGVVMALEQESVWMETVNQNEPIFMNFYRYIHDYIETNLEYLRVFPLV